MGVNLTGIDTDVLNEIANRTRGSIPRAEAGGGDESIVVDNLIPKNSEVEALNDMLRQLVYTKHAFLGNPTICAVSQAFYDTEYCKKFKQLMRSEVEDATLRISSESHHITLRGNIVARCRKWREERADKIAKGRADLEFASFADLTPPEKFKQDWQIIILMRDGVDIFSASETDKRKLVALLRAQLYLHRYALPADRNGREYDSFEGFGALLSALRGIRNAQSDYYIPIYGAYPEAWDVTQCTDMSHFFAVANNYTRPPANIAFPMGAWDTSSVEKTRWFFQDSKLNVYIGQWNVTSLQNAHGMFANCKTFDQPIDEWDLVSLKDAKHMFDNCNPEFAQAYVAHVGKYI